ncbi:thioredoxin family protein [Candidatus Endoriftia persephone]|jgi:glutaredoxin|nr:thioredoxin family protein [Candidatus Endoriftia persephone]USF88673.1 thioredoxin family protein [Candidatus Endoriftia persephone]
MAYIQIELFTAPDCSQCGRAKQRLQAIVDGWTEGEVDLRMVNVLEELDYAVQIGVLATPAIAIDGELVFTALPSEKRLRQTLQQRIDHSSS